jgi:hypothetical protein
MAAALATRLSSRAALRWTVGSVGFVPLVNEVG